jgi:hypothetical protein
LMILVFIFSCFWVWGYFIWIWRWVYFGVIYSSFSILSIWIRKTINCASIFILSVHNFIVFNGIVLGFEFQSISSLFSWI